MSAMFIGVAEATEVLGVSESYVIPFSRHQSFTVIPWGRLLHSRICSAHWFKRV